MVTRVQDLPLDKDGTLVEVVKVTSAILFLKIKGNIFRIGRNKNNKLWVNRERYKGDKAILISVPYNNGRYKLCKVEPKAEIVKIDKPKVKKELDESCERLLKELGYERHLELSKANGLI